MTRGRPSLPYRFLRMLAIRLMQFFGNLLKLLFYVHFRLMPRARFTLPPVSPPLWKSSRPQRVSRILWQTNYTDCVTLPVYVNYLWNRLMAPTHEHRFCNDDVCAEFIRTNYPGPVQIWGSSPTDGYKLLVNSSLDLTANSESREGVQRIAELVERQRLAVEAHARAAVAFDLALYPHEDLGVDRLRAGKAAPDATEDSREQEQ